MPTKAELEKKIEDKQQQIDSLIAERGIFYTDLLKLAYHNKFAPLIEFLNPTPQEIIDTENDLKENGFKLISEFEFESNPIYYKLVWCEKCEGYLPIMTKFHYECPNCKEIIHRSCWNCDWREIYPHGEHYCGYKNCNMGKFPYYEEKADTKSVEPNTEVKICDWIPFKKEQKKDDNKKPEKSKPKTKSLFNY
jgi:hypothetical protein